jgi:hypothetical protein
MCGIKTREKFPVRPWRIGQDWHRPEFFVQPKVSQPKPIEMKVPTNSFSQKRYARSVDNPLLTLALAIMKKQETRYKQYGCRPSTNHSLSQLRLKESSASSLFVRRNVLCHLGSHIRAPVVSLARACCSLLLIWMWFGIPLTVNAKLYF